MRRETKANRGVPSHAGRKGALQLRRVVTWLALSGLWAAACSFPDYEFSRSLCSGPGLPAGTTCHVVYTCAGDAACGTGGEAGQLVAEAGVAGEVGTRVLGCWAPDQRPWQYCVTADCTSDRCKRAATDSTCAMYRPAFRSGTWPPAGYPGENQ